MVPLLPGDEPLGVALSTVRRTAAQGNDESAYYARWLSDPTNNIGFRNVGERNAVIGYRLVDVIVQNEPTGVGCWR